MNTLYLILLLLAAVFFFLSALNVAVHRISLLSLGLFCWVLVPLIQIVKVL